MDSDAIRDVANSSFSTEEAIATLLDEGSGGDPQIVTHAGGKYLSTVLLLSITLKICRFCFYSGDPFWWERKAR